MHTVHYKSHSDHDLGCVVLMMKQPLNSRKAVLGAFLGTIIEYYDYSLFGFSSGVLAMHFFPTQDKLTALIYTYGIYAMGYVGKPLGGIFFSHLGDCYGRKAALRFSILGIAVPTFVIGLLPSYLSSGRQVVYLLLVCRFFQGFFVGGEYDGAALYVIEHLGKKYHYTASAATRATGVLGLLLSTAVVSLSGYSGFPDWAWRVPFLLALPLALWTTYLRKHMVETPDFVKSQQPDALGRLAALPLRAFLKHQLRMICKVILLAGGFGATYQIGIIGVKHYLSMLLPETEGIIRSFHIILVFSFGLCMPLAGWLADRFGPKRVIACSTLLTLIGACTLAFAIQSGHSIMGLGAAWFVGISVAPFNALAHGAIVQAFPVVQQRHRGISIGHSIGSLLMSGTANMLAMKGLQKTGWALFPITYLMVFTLVAWGSFQWILLRPTTRTRKLLNR